MSKNTISKKDIKLLWGSSGNICAICHIKLTREQGGFSKYPIGVMAHIEGEKQSSARYNELMSDNERNRYDNLILLCPNCHTTIDNDVTQYTVDKLKKIKKEHEKWVSETLRTQTAKITFAELEVIVKYLIGTPMLEGQDSLTVVPPREKIKRNNLSIEVENLITSGMLQVKQVREYLNKHPDIGFGEQLKAGFVKEYLESRKNGLDGDALFYSLLDFASNNSSDFLYRSAGLSVLTYFFEICEVFEK